MKAPCGGMFLDDAFFELDGKTLRLKINTETGDVTQLSLKVSEIDGRLNIIETTVEETIPVTNTEIEEMFK